jgi:hypothetical protein
MVLNAGSDHGVYDSTPYAARHVLASTERDKATAGLLLFIVLLAKAGALCATPDPSPRPGAPHSAST